ncbi:MAG: TatD family hydrolase [Spirosomataceae bacterium]
MLFVNLHSHSPVYSSAEIGLYNLRLEEVLLLEQPSTYFSLGIHPWFIHEQKIEAEIALVKKETERNNVLAIGECGLDRTVNVSIKMQEKIFIAQLKWAEHLQKPVIIHCVKAFPELIAIKKQVKPTVPLIIHGFNNNLIILEQLLKNGFYFSLGAALRHPGSNASQSIKRIPIERLFLETDDQNVPILAIFAVASERLNCSVEELKAQCWQNFQRIVHPSI